MKLSTFPLAGVSDLSAILDLVDTGIVHLDERGRIQFMNTAAEQCLQLGRERTLGRTLDQAAFIPPELREALLQRGESSSSGLRLHELILAGGQYDCSIRSDDQGRYLLEFHNLEWEHKRTRLQQREMQTGLLELLSRNLGHEIRNPLGGIRGASQMLASELESQEMAELARLIMREADRIDELIQKFGQPQMAQLEVDFYPLLDEVLALVRAEFGTKTIIDRDFDPSIPLIPGDEAAIRQVLLNLVRNAFQAGATRIQIRTRVEHGGALLQTTSSSLLRIDIIDDGEGVPEPLRKLLFLPLVTGKRSGTGLGLALSQQIAAAHGGLLTYEPLAPVSTRPGAAGEGSRFSVYLPLEKPDTADPQQSHK